MCDKRFTKSHHLKAHLTTHEKHKNLALMNQTNDLLIDNTTTTPIIIQEENDSITYDATSNYADECITPDIIIYNDLIKWELK